MINVRDQEARSCAITTTDKNIVVEAGAGTGKTTLLISRLCYLMIAKGINVERLVALTFTEKAATEIKVRLAQQLQKILKEVNNPATKDNITKDLLANLDAADITARAQSVLERLDRGFISTIHGFCSYILSSYPVEAGISPTAVIDEGSRRENIFKRQWYKWLDTELAEDGPQADKWARVLAEINLEDIYNYALEMSSGKIEDYHPLSHSKMLSEVCFENASVAEQMSTAFIPAGKSRKIERALASAALVLQESGFCLKEGRLSADNPPPDAVTSSDQAKGWDDENFETAQRIVEFARAIHPARQALVKEVFELVETFVRDVRENFARQGLISFDDLLVKTRNLLKNNLSVRNALKKQFEILFVDEFQDTDPVQGELLLFLAEEDDSSAKTWQDIKLKPGKLFVVGDPKQSIYRFRGADITAYHLFTELILKQGGTQCFLQTNFRSAANIIDFVNRVGDTVIREATGFQPAYVPIFAHKTVADPAVEEVIIKSDTKQSANDNRHNQAEFTAKWIKDNVGVYKRADGKTLDYKDICILMRTSGAFNIFTDALKRHGVKYTVEEDRNFYTAQEITDLLTLLALLENPRDKTALAGVLRTPFAGFTDSELYNIFKLELTDIYAKALPAQYNRLREFYAQLRPLAAQVGRVTLGELIQNILNTTMFVECAQRAYNGEQTISNINKFAALTAREAANAPLSLGQFLSNIKDSAKQTRGEGESPLADEFLSTVSIMTIHKSKGLEFPVVFLADTFRVETNKSNDYAYSWFHNMHGLKAGGFADANLAFLEVQAVWHSKAEEARILYVALTRAKDKLFILGNAEQGKKTAARHFMNAGVWPVDMDGFPIKPLVNVDITYEDFKKPEDFIYKVDASASQQGAFEGGDKWLAAWNKRAALYDAVKQERLFISPSSLGKPAAAVKTAANAATLTGDVCHKVMEMWDFKTQITAENIDAAIALLDVPQEFLGEVRHDAINIFTVFNFSPVFDEFTELKVLAREMPFTKYENGKIINGVIDLVAEYKGKLTVFDYKTDRAENPAVYQAQLDSYKTTAKEIFKTDADSAILFLRLGKII
ncbi:ATP-dependent helicase/nuclease subunit A [Elusimicrobium simillimum]|uniref:UvrD-helicase domain-containing protein n=1 Tax=Elusimicrobium simillimum TaxID=3143438 RepID=UPI003C70446D